MDEDQDLLRSTLLAEQWFDRGAHVLHQLPGCDLAFLPQVGSGDRRLHLYGDGALERRHAT